MLPISLLYQGQKKELATNHFYITINQISLQSFGTVDVFTTDFCFTSDSHCNNTTVSPTSQNIQILPEKKKKWQDRLCLLHTISQILHIKTLTF